MLRENLVQEADLLTKPNFRPPNGLLTMNGNGCPYINGQLLFHHRSLKTQESNESIYRGFNKNVLHQFEGDIEATIY